MLEDKEIQKNKKRKQKNKQKGQYQALLVVENNELTLLLSHWRVPSPILQSLAVVGYDHTSH